MIKFSIDIGEDTEHVLRRVFEESAEDVSSFGALIERLLRTHPTVETAREELGVNWEARRKPGKPKTVVG